MKKYNKIVSSFTKTIKKLEDLSKVCVEQSQQLTRKISVMETKKLNIVSEGVQASVTADKLKNVFKLIERQK